VNRRHTSKGLRHNQVRDLWDAWHHARRIGCPLNALISLRPLDCDDLSPLDRWLRWGCFLNKLGIYARQHGFKFVAIWTRECNPDATGEHLHVLMHVPKKWRSRCEETLFRWHPGPGEMDVGLADYRVRYTANGRRLSAVGYVMKQMTPQAWFRRGLLRRAGGPILGKRGGCTRNIGWKAREAFWRLYDRPPAPQSGCEQVQQAEAASTAASYAAKQRAA
jgi:hypothetical protein